MTAERVFLDANVLFSAAYQDGLARSLWTLVRAGDVRLLSSRLALDEAEINLALKGPEGAVDRLHDLQRDVEVVTVAADPRTVPAGLPGADRLLLATAVAARADVFLTGDHRHFGPLFGTEVRGVRVLAVRDYIAGRRM